MKNLIASVFLISVVAITAPASALDLGQVNPDVLDALTDSVLGGSSGGRSGGSDAFFDAAAFEENCLSRGGELIREIKPNGRLGHRCFVPKYK